MPAQKYRVETDKGTFEIEVEAPASAPNPHVSPITLKGGDTVNGKDLGETTDYWEAYRKSLKDQGKDALYKLLPMLKPVAEPKTVSDFGNLAIPEIGGAIGATAHAAEGPILAAGDALQRAGKAARPAGLQMGALDAILTHGVKNGPGLAQGAGIAAAPYAVEGLGRILQKAPGAIRRAATEPISMFEPKVAPAMAAEASPVADKLKQMAAEMGQTSAETGAKSPLPQSVDNYTPPPKDVPTPGDVPDMASPDSVESIIARETQALGRPRVLSWKEGQGPSPEMAGQLRDEMGSKDAARQLATTPAQIQELAPRMDPRALPSAVRDRMEKAMSTMGPEELQQYLDSAPNDLADAFIRQRMP